MAALFGRAAPVGLDGGRPSRTAADHVVVPGGLRGFLVPAFPHVDSSTGLAVDGWAVAQAERGAERRTAAPLALTALTGPLRSAAACAGLCSLLLSGGGDRPRGAPSSLPSRPLARRGS